MRESQNRLIGKAPIGNTTMLAVIAIIGVRAMTKWTITITDAGRQDIPATVRLRKLLKILLRSLGFRCTDIREAVDSSDATTAENRHQSNADARKGIG